MDTKIYIELSNKSEQLVINGDMNLFNQFYDSLRSFEVMDFREKSNDMGLIQHAAASPHTERLQTTR